MTWEDVAEKTMSSPDRCELRVRLDAQVWRPSRAPTRLTTQRIIQRPDMGERLNVLFCRT
jgi:hypothetical protein